MGQTSAFGKLHVDLNLIHLSMICGWLIRQWEAGCSWPVDHHKGCWGISSPAPFARCSTEAHAEAKCNPSCIALVLLYRAGEKHQSMHGFLKCILRGLHTVETPQSRLERFSSESAALCVCIVCDSLHHCRIVCYKKLKTIVSSASRCSSWNLSNHWQV